MPNKVLCKEICHTYLLSCTAVPKKGLTEREREAGPEEKKPGAVYRDNRRGQHPGGTNKQSEMGDKIGQTGLQISNGTLGSTKEKKSLDGAGKITADISWVHNTSWDYVFGYLWQLLSSVLRCVGHTQPVSPLYCLLDSVTSLRPCFPGREGRGHCKTCSLLGCPASIWITNDRSQIKDISSPDAVLLLESIKSIISISNSLQKSCRSTQTWYILIKPHNELKIIRSQGNWKQNQWSWHGFIKKNEKPQHNDDFLIMLSIQLCKQWKTIKRVFVSLWGKFFKCYLANNNGASNKTMVITILHYLLKNF